MHTFSKKNMAIIFALILTVSLVASSFMFEPNVTAHTPAWQFTTYAYISAAPNPVGLDQNVLIFVGIDYTIQGNSIDNTIRFRNYRLDITKPDGTNDTKTWDIVTDTTASAYYSYAPTVAGNYTLNFYFPGQVYDYGTQYPAYAAYNNDTYTASHASMTLVVQQDKVPKLPENPLPTEYWTRPINGQNHAWELVSSNWLGGTTTTGSQTIDIWQKNGDAPRSAHVMWTKQIEFGGMTGGGVNQIGNDNDTALTYYTGFSYNTRFGNPMIVNGILYYTTPNGEAGSGGGYYGVDLRTGTQEWQSDTISPNKAQLIDFQTPNQHGVIASIMWVVSGTTWIGYNQFTMKPVMNITGVPSGTEVYTNEGNILRYVLSYNATTKSGTLALWNETAAISNQNLLYNGPGWPNSGVAVINGSAPNAYTWTMPIGDLSGPTSPSIVGVIPGDIMLGRSSNVGLSSTPNPNTNPWTMWALNLNASKGTIGQTLWIQNYSAPAGNLTRMLDWQPIDPVTRAWVMTDFENSQRLAYNLDDGNLRWGPVGNFPGFQYFSAREGLPAYGNLYVTGYGGIVYCYSMTDGALLWTYGNGGAGNSTSSYDETPWGHYPTHAAAFADGMIFTMSGEHSPNTPLYKGYKARALDAFTGAEIWKLSAWSASGLGTSVAPVAIADGYLAFANAYDGQVYVVGKGPSAMTATSSKVAALGQSVLIEGTVTDISAGTQQPEQAARFPNGVAAISDASQGAWMEYVYQQQNRPANATGVLVTISVVDANGNFRDIGTATSDSDGYFSLNWKPDIEGKFSVYASFAGSASYYPSHAETAFMVDPAPATPAPPTPVTQAPIETYFMEATAAIIAAIAIVGAVILLVVRKRP